MRREPVVIGISDHHGWAVFVCVGVRDRAPVVLDRRRIDLLESGIPKHPFHHEALKLDTAEAEALVQKVAASAERCATGALAKIQKELDGLKLAALVMREPPLPAVPSVEASNGSPWINTRADATLYLGAVANAARALRIAVEKIPRGEEGERAAALLSCSEERVTQWCAGLRSALGAPWQKDHQEAALRAIATLGKHAALKLPVEE
jgi:hypothetical protein